MDIIKTWPAKFPRKFVLEIFQHKWGSFYFGVGRGKPQQPVKFLWYTHQGDVIGRFTISHFVFNETETTLPPLRSITGEVSQWQFAPGIWVAICRGKFLPFTEPLKMAGFRGWRYFELERYRGSLDALLGI